MSNLQNTNLRVRDVLRLAGYKYQYLRWEPGCSETNEWGIASTSDEKHRHNLDSWLLSKDIDPDTDVVAVTLVNTTVSRYKWEDIQANPGRIFNGTSVTLFEADFKWQLQYAEQEIARFGRYENA
jgi:hypothetical protein